MIRREVIEKFMRQSFAKEISSWGALFEQKDADKKTWAAILPPLELELDFHSM